MTDPITRLNAALEGRYRIEREIGAGGVAQDPTVVTGLSVLVVANWFQELRERMGAGN